VARTQETDPEATQRLKTHVHKEVLEKGRMMALWRPKGKSKRPVLPPWLPYYIASPVYDIPKRANGVPIVPAAYRFIHNLSHGKIEGVSVNDHIDKERYRCTYTTFDSACQQVRTQGAGSSITVADMPDAFRIVPIVLADIPLLGFVLDDMAYLDAFLPFGLTSAPFQYSRFALALRDVARGVAQGNAAVTSDTPQWWQLMDDFWIIEAAGRVLGDSMVAARLGKSMFLHLLGTNGLVPKPEKTRGPATTLVLLGLEIDTERMEIRVPPARIQALRDILKAWMGEITVTKQKIQSLVGALSFACFGVRWGRAFLRRLIHLSATLPFQHSTTELDADALADVAWWFKYALWDGYTGVSLILALEPITLRRLAVYFYTDSSGRCCAGGWQDRWFCHDFTESQLLWHISIKELYSAVAVCLTFGSELRGRIVVVECDNEAACVAINATRAFDPIMNSLIRELYFCTALYSFQVRAVWVPGATNTLGDALSRPELRHKAWEIRPSLHRNPLVPTLPTMQW
jgi:hypothetical protein